jgi:hypothetical protein
MPSIYKNAPKKLIADAITDLARQSFPFQQLILQRDSFWIYSNCRRYWGRYSAALRDLGVLLPEACTIKNELGKEIDWWDFQEGQVQRECLGMLTEHLFKTGVDLSPKGLKKSRYFDLYIDAVLLFGTYDKLIEYADIDREQMKEHILPQVDIDVVLSPVFDLYTSSCQNHEEKCRKITGAKLVGTDMDIESITKGFALCPVIVDGANVARSRRNNEPSIENIKLIDQYLQTCGFNKQNINFVFDAAFRYDVPTEKFDIFLAADYRMSLAPPNEQADGPILTSALNLLQKQPDHPPFIITNDKFEDYFQRYPEFSPLKTRKRGVTWSYIQKQPRPIINFTFIEGA